MDDVAVAARAATGDGMMPPGSMPGADDNSGLQNRVPHDLDAERSTLGSILLDPEVVPDVQNVLGSERAFYSEKHRVIYRALSAMFEAGDAIDLVTVSEHLRVRGDLEVVGSIGYLVALAEGTTTAAYATHYAGIVRKNASLRQVIAVGQKMVSLASAGLEDAETVLGQAQTALAGLLTGVADGDYRRAPEVAADAVAYISELMQAEGAPTGIPSGLADLDAALHGWQKGRVYVIAARPAMGKTAAAMGAAWHAAKRDLSVGIFSLEMPDRDLFLRLAATEGRVNLERLHNGRFGSSDAERLAQAVTKISASRLLFNDLADLTVTQLRTKARLMAARDGLDLLVVDYLQLLAPESGRGGGENRQQDVSRMSRGLKMLARELDVPVIVLSQLSRQVEQRPNKRPLLSDLRESGAVEQDADAVIFIYRDDYYDQDSVEAGIAEFIIAKNRFGMTTTVKTQWTAEHTSFRDLARLDRAPHPHA